MHFPCFDPVSISTGPAIILRRLSLKFLVDTSMGLTFRRAEHSKSRIRIRFTQSVARRSATTL